MPRHTTSPACKDYRCIHKRLFSEPNGDWRCSEGETLLPAELVLRGARLTSSVSVVSKPSLRASLQVGRCCDPTRKKKRGMWWHTWCCHPPFFLNLVTTLPFRLSFSWTTMTTGAFPQRQARNRASFPFPSPVDRMSSPAVEKRAVPEKHVPVARTHQANITSARDGQATPAGALFAGLPGFSCLYLPVSGRPSVQVKHLASDLVFSWMTNHPRNDFEPARLCGGWMNRKVEG